MHFDWSRYIVGIGWSSILSFLVLKDSVFFTFDNARNISILFFFSQEREVIKRNFGIVHKVGTTTNRILRNHDKGHDDCLQFRTARALFCVFVYYTSLPVYAEVTR